MIVSPLSSPANPGHGTTLPDTVSDASPLGTHTAFCHDFLPLTFFQRSASVSSTISAPEHLENPIHKSDAELTPTHGK